MTYNRRDTTAADLDEGSPFSFNLDHRFGFISGTACLIRGGQRKQKRFHNKSPGQKQPATSKFVLAESGLKHTCFCQLVDPVGLSPLSHQTPVPSQTPARTDLEKGHLDRKAARDNQVGVCTLHF